MKKNEPSWLDDPVVEEIRGIRRKLWKEAGETVHGYMERIEKIAQQESPRERKKSDKTRAKTAPQAGRPVAKRLTGKQPRKAG